MYEPRSKIQRNCSLQYELDEKLMYVGHIDKAVGVVGGRVWKWLGRGGRVSSTFLVLSAIIMGDKWAQ